MKPLKLINPQLQKPWVLIACYDKAFENYLSLLNMMETSKRKFFNNGRATTSWQESLRYKEINDKIQTCSEYLRELDQKIHAYIISRNQPQEYLKAS